MTFKFVGHVLDLDRISFEVLVGRTLADFDEEIEVFNFNKHRFHWLFLDLLLFLFIFEGGSDQRDFITAKIP